MPKPSERYAYNRPVPPYKDTDPYELAIRSQAGAEEILDELGAIDEIRDAVLAHCEEHLPTPPWRPQLIKDRLQPRGWAPEARVPPYTAKLDDWPINERYDALKFFAHGEGGEVGVAFEMNNWAVHRDLLKFRRGLKRGQIVAGVILHPDYYDCHYWHEHARLMNEPLFGTFPVLYCCPRGPGLREPVVRRTSGKPFPMPRKPSSKT